MVIGESAWLWIYRARAFFLTLLTIFGSVLLLGIAYEVQLLFLKISTFLPPPPPVITNSLELNPEGYGSENWKLWSHSNSWANLAAILTLVALIVIVVLIRLRKSLHATPKTIGFFLLVALVLLALYFIAINKLTVVYDGSFLEHAKGHRFVVGLVETPALKAYRAGDPTSSTSTIIDDFPERLDGLWEPTSIQTAFYLLGVLYVLTALFFAITLIIAADLGLEMIIEVYRHHRGTASGTRGEKPVAVFH